MLYVVCGTYVQGENYCREIDAKPQRDAIILPTGMRDHVQKIGGRIITDADKVVHVGTDYEGLYFDEIMDQIESRRR